MKLNRLKRKVALFFVATSVIMTGYATPGVRIERQGEFNSDVLYNESLVDLSVKVLGKKINIKRNFLNGQWYFLSNFKTLTFEKRVSNGDVTSITRSNREYKKEGDDFYRVDEVSFIRPVDNGWKWQNTKGDWELYDNAGKLLESGNRTAAKIKILYTDGRISSVQDSFGNEVVKMTYEAGQLSKVEDYGGRFVIYKYLEGMLSEVQDVLGHTWKYTYQTFSTKKFGDIKLIKERHEPNGRIFNVTHRIIPEHKVCAEGIGYKVEFDEQKKEWVTRYQKCLKYVTIPEKLMFVGTGDNNNGQPTSINSYSHTYDPKKKVYKTAEVYANGLRKVKTFNLKGNLVAEENGDIEPVKSVWTNNHRIKTSVQGDKEVTKEYDMWGNITKVTYSDGSTLTKTFKPATDLVRTETNRAGVLTQYDYDSNNSLIKKTEAVGTDIERITTYDYDSYGQVVKVITANKDNTESYETTYDYDDFGNLIERNDPSGVTTFSNFNSLGNAQRVETTDTVTEYVYDSAGNMTKYVSPFGFTRETVYNKMGYPVEEKTNSDGKTSVKKMEYDERNKLIDLTTEFDGKAVLDYMTKDNKIVYEENGVEFTKEFDQLGRETRFAKDGKTYYEIKYDGSSKRQSELKNQKIITNFKYDEWDREIEKIVTSVDAPAQSYKVEKSYNGFGKLKTVKTPDGVTTEYLYDDLGRNTSIKNLKTGYEIQYTYNLLDQVTSMTKPNGKLLSKRTYNKNGNLEREYFGESDNYVLYEYDSKHRLVKQTYPSGDILQTVYKNGFISEKNYFASESDFLAKQPARQELIESEGLGFIKSVVVVEKGLNLIKYEYDYTKGKLNEGRIVFFAEDGTQAFTKQVKYARAENGELGQYVSPEGIVFDYIYSGDTDLSEIRFSAGTIHYDYDVELSSISYPNGVKSTLQYNHFGAHNGIVVKDASDTELLSLEYELDAMGYVQSRAKSGVTRTYGYDKYNNLTSVSGEVVELNASFLYDESGNRLRDLGNNLTYSYEDDQLKSDGDKAFEYNFEGNLVKASSANTTINYVYDVAMNLISVERDGTELQRNSYDHAGRRVRKTVNGQVIFFLYDERGLLSEYDISGKLIKGYNYLPSENFSINPVVMFEPAGSDYEFFYFHNDLLKTPQILTDKNGQTVWEADYKVFGEALISKEEVVNNLRFPGQYFDAETGLHYNYMRFYDPEIGRYLQSDPQGIDGDNNPYVYADSMPTVFYDAPGAASSSSKSGGNCKAGADNCVGTSNQVGGKVECSSGKKLGKCEIGFARGVGGGASIEHEEYSAGGHKCLRVSVCINVKVGISFKIKCSAKDSLDVLDFFIDMPDGELKCEGPGFFPDKVRTGCGVKKSKKICLNKAEVQWSGELACSASACWSTHCCWCEK